MCDYYMQQLNGESQFVGLVLEPLVNDKVIYYEVEE